MTKEERVALMNSQDFEWERMDDIPEMIRSFDEQEEDLSPKNKPKASKSHERKHSLDEENLFQKIHPLVHDHAVLKSLQQTLSYLGEISTELKNVHRDCQLVYRQIQEVLNFSIRQLEMLERLAHKFPNVRVFRNALDETQEIIEKIIKIQDTATKAMGTSLSLSNKAQGKEKDYSKNHAFIYALIALHSYEEKILQGKIGLKEIQSILTAQDLDSKES